MHLSHIGPKISVVVTSNPLVESSRFSQKSSLEFCHMCASDHAHSDHKLAIMHAVSLVDELFFCCDDKMYFIYKRFVFVPFYKEKKKSIK